MIQDNQLSSPRAQNPNLSIAPDLLWSVMQNNFAQVAWRRVVLPKKHIASASRHDQPGPKSAFPTHNQSKFTGSPAFKELKNLIVLILTSQACQKQNS